MSAPARSTQATASVPTDGADGGPRIYGVVDVLRPDRVSGWAIDRADSAAALEIDLLREGRAVATVRADRPRKDLERSGVGTGRYGFVFDLAPPLEPGFEFTLSLRARTADGIRTEIRRSGTTAAPTDPDRRLLERLFEELCRLRFEPPPTAPDPDEGRAELMRRIELAQIRIEAALCAVEPPAPPSLAGLKVLFGVALAVALGSLALGLVSMWGP